MGLVPRYTVLNISCRILDIKLHDALVEGVSRWLGVEFIGRRLTCGIFGCIVDECASDVRLRPAFWC